MESQLEQKQQQILSNFDVLIRDCAEHQNKLYEKILEIMTDSVEAVIEGQWMVRINNYSEPLIFLVV